MEDLQSGIFVLIVRSQGMVHREAGSFPHAAMMFRLCASLQHYSLLCNVSFQINRCQSVRRPKHLCQIPKELYSVVCVPTVTRPSSVQRSANGKGKDIFVYLLSGNINETHSITSIYEFRLPIETNFKSVYMNDAPHTL